MKQLILGTVQLGINYGINNRVGKPSLDTAFDILNRAYDKGVRILDTASAYGDSEKIIGDFMKSTRKRFEICTKLPKININEDVIVQIENSFNESLNNLGVHKIDYFLYHNFDDLITYPKILEYIKRLKGEGLVKNIGVSIYDVEEMKYIIKNISDFIDIIQIPFNIFDLRWISGNLLKEAKEKDIKIAIRSVFLQGLFFVEEEKANKIHPKAFDYINKLKKISINKNASVEEIAISFVKQQENIDYILIGCETIEQLDKNVEFFNNNIEFTKEEIEFIQNEFQYIDKKIIDPRLWN